ncbi:hypothetical protein [Listeria rocourtiae]|uniref:hypothetical protein n=1 Tax=Listeria rocourtiae TaxID=647910 RepID=UPI003D2F92FB
MDFLTVHGLLPREPNLLLPLLDLSNLTSSHSDFYHTQTLKNHQILSLSNSGKLIHVVEGQLLQQISNPRQNKQIINAIWTETDFIFHNVFQLDCYEYMALGHVELEIYDAEIVLKELTKQPFFPDLLIDALKRQECQIYRYFHMLTKSVRERVIDTIKLLSEEAEEGYYIPKKVNYFLLAKCCQISPHTAKKAMHELELENKIIYRKDKTILLDV